MRIVGMLVTVAFVVGLAAHGSSGRDSDRGDDSAAAAASASDGSATTTAGVTRVSDEEAVKNTVMAYTTALAARDGDAACKVLTDELQKALATQGGAEVPSVKTCAQATEAGARAIGQNRLEKLRDPEIVSVTVRGPNAIVGLQAAEPMCSPRPTASG